MAASDRAACAVPPRRRSGYEAIVQMYGIPMKKLLTRFRRGEEGAAMAEYALLVALIAVVAVVAITTLGTQISTQFSTVASAVGV